MTSIKEKVNSIEEFNYLYDAVGWGSMTKKIGSQIMNKLLVKVNK